MKIDEAIELLQQEKENGNQNIILVYWTADAFHVKDDKEWENVVEIADSDMDFSESTEAIIDLMESLKD